MYECLDGLRKAHRRLWDRLRKHAREDLAAQDAEIVRQAWELVQSRTATIGP
jgi:hypothetical protein